MHLSSNVSHWVCVLSGLLLVVTGLVSHLPRRTASTGLRTEGDTDTGIMRRAVMVVIGLGAVVYGVSRLIS